MGGKNKKRKDRGAKERKILNVRHHNKGMPLATKISIGTVVSVLIILLAYFYNQYQSSIYLSTLEDTLKSLLEEEQSAIVEPGTKVAIGFGSCQDIIVQSKEVVFDQPPKYPEHYFSISNKEEFLKVLAYFYRHGAAAERFISNSSFFNQLVNLAKQAPSAQYHIGGNAPIMAERFVKEGCEVLLGAQLSKSLASQFPEKITISGPFVEEDDIHLLLEYPAGQRWGPYIPPRANRFIVHNDHQNPQLTSIDSFVKKLDGYNPNLLVVGGLQMMDNFPMSQTLQLEQLEKIKNLMKKQPDSVRIHFEMASYSDEGLLRGVVDHVIPYADSLGMNEQELPNLHHMLKYGNMSLISESRPRIAAVLDDMRDIFKLQDTLVQDAHGRRKLTRLHVHTLAFQAILVDKRSVWKNTKAAAAKSALTAYRHTCGSDIVDVKKSKLLMDDAFTTSLADDARRVPFDTRDPISCWEENNAEVCIAPVLVCTEVLQTGGGGDNISSAGLVLQI